MGSSNLVQHFSRAGLPLELAERSLAGRFASDIVQLDVARPDARVKHERFRLFLGASGNRVEVENVDKPLRQLVLLVHEPRRRFQTFVSS